MGRRLKRHELLDLLAQTRAQLQDLEPQYPLPSPDQERETSLEQRGAWGLHRGRLHGLAEAYSIILARDRWGPVNQARAHDALLEVANQIWLRREAEMADLRMLKYPEPAIAAGTMLFTGQLDAVRAASKAIAGYLEQVRALPDIAHPERARMQTRDRTQERGVGY